MRAAARIEADSPQAGKATKPAEKERPTEAPFSAIGFVLLRLRTMSGKPVAAQIKKAALENAALQKCLIAHSKLCLLYCCIGSKPK